MQDVVGQGCYSTVKAIGNEAVKTINHKNFESSVREIAIIRMLSHPNIIKITKIEYCKSTTNIHMKRYDCDLSVFLLENLSLDVIYNLGYQLLSGVNYIHSAGVIHCDLKPQNLLIDIKSLKLVICDFGIASLEEEKYHTSVVQTYTYRAPEINFERSRIQYSASIDMWSVGCILYEMVSKKTLISNSDDISTSICKLFRLQIPDTRKQRMKLLKAVNLRHIADCISFELQDVDPKYIGIVAGCLQNRIQRLTSIDVLNVLCTLCLNTLPNTTQYNTQSTTQNNRRYITAELAVDTMLCVRCIPEELITVCSHKCLNLAETIYVKYMLLMPNIQNQLNIQYSCIFIASCIYSGSINIGIITKYISREVLLSISAHIMLKLVGRLF